MGTLIRSRRVRIAVMTLLGLAALLAAAAGLLAFSMQRQQPQMFAEPRVDEVAPDLPALSTGPGVLVFSKTNGYRHAEAIVAADALFAQLGQQHGWSVVSTANAAVFNPAQLSRFAAVVWSNATGPALTATQRQALQAFITSGGGFVAIHSAGDDSHAEWPWYQDEVIRARFIGHPLMPQFQDATVHTEAPAHPAMRHLPASWRHNEEWYSFAASPRARGVDVLATVDESSYVPGRWMNLRALAMGADHPVIWSHATGQGRVFYSALGHQASTFADPRFRELLAQAVIWAARLDQPPAAAGAAPVAR